MDIDDTQVHIGSNTETPTRRKKTVKVEIPADLSVLTTALVAMTVSVQKTNSPLLIE